MLSTLAIHRSNVYVVVCARSSRETYERARTCNRVYVHAALTRRATTTYVHFTTYGARRAYVVETAALC